MNDLPDADDGLRHGLPHARGQGFATLDDYLKHLERQSAIGLPHYRAIKPDCYAYVTTKVDPENKDGLGMRLFTRDDLLKRYGFSE